MDPAVIRRSKCKATCCAKSAAAPPKEAAPHPPPPEPPKKVELPPPQQLPAANNEVAPLVDPRSGQYHGRACHPTAQPFPPPVHMRGCFEDFDPPLSRILRLENSDMTLARGYRTNECYYDAGHYYGYPPPPAPPPKDYYNHRHRHGRHYHHYGPPPVEYDFHHHRSGPPPMEYDFHHHHRHGPPLQPPPPHAYYPYSYFSDENPNGCSVM